MSLMTLEEVVAIAQYPGSIDVKALARTCIASEGRLASPAITCAALVAFLQPLFS